MKYIVYGCVSLVGVCVLVFGLAAFNLGFYKFWAPKYKAVEREVFEQSKPYVQGKITYLNRLKGDYIQATEEQKPALRQVILREASQIDRDLLPADLKSFIEGLE